MPPAPSVRPRSSRRATRKFSGSRTSWQKPTMSWSASSAGSRLPPSPEPALPYPEQLERPRIALAEHTAQPRVLRLVELGVDSEELLGRAPCSLAEFLVAQRVRDPERRDATLTLAEQVAH